MPDDRLAAAFALLPHEQRYGLAMYMLDVRDRRRPSASRNRGDDFVHNEAERSAANNALILLTEAQRIARDRQRTEARR